MKVTCSISTFYFQACCDVYHTPQLAGLYILLSQSSDDTQYQRSCFGAEGFKAE
jgi:hypothetical protein